MADFGFAAPAEGRFDGYLTSGKGTREYMPPEIWAGKAYKGHSVDVFALGVLLFFMVAGRAPFGY